jgi:glycosyltransferase involved in cell wall biosynthesis
MSDGCESSSTIGFATESSTSRHSSLITHHSSLCIGIIGHLLSFDATYRHAGVSRYVEALLRELPALASDPRAGPAAFVVFTGRDHSPAERGFDPRLRWVHAPLPTGEPALRILWEQTTGMTIARRFGLDVVHAPVNVTPLVTGAPRVVTIHDLAFHHYPQHYPGWKGRYLRLLTRLSVRRAARVIAVSETTRRDVIRLYRADPARVVAIPNGVSEEYQRLPAGEIASFRQAQGLTRDFVLFVGTLQPRKNLETLLRAYARVADEIGWDLVVVGAEGWQYAPVFATARELGLAESVRFAGFVPDATLPLWYNAAGMVACPSLYEGFGLPLLEAMACGAPVIAADVSSLPEVVGDAGLLVPPGDVDGWARAIQMLARNPARRDDLAQRGLRRAGGYSWRRTAAETLAVYRGVMRDAGCGMRDA